MGVQGTLYVQRVGKFLISLVHLKKKEHAPSCVTLSPMEYCKPMHVSGPGLSSCGGSK